MYRYRAFIYGIHGELISKHDIECSVDDLNFVRFTLEDFICKHNLDCIEYEICRLADKKKPACYHRLTN